MNRLEGRFAAQQIPGGREYEEDDYGLIQRGDADGLGGHVSGDAASRTVVKTFVETYPATDGPIPDRLHACLAAANDALADATSENPEMKGMGSTVVAAVLPGRTARMTHAPGSPDAAGDASSAWQLPQHDSGG